MNVCRNIEASWRLKDLIVGKVEKQRAAYNIDLLYNVLFHKACVCLFFDITFAYR